MANIQDQNITNQQENVEVNNNEVVENNIQSESSEQQNIDEKQYSEAEKSALKRGWKPLEQYDGDKSKWRTAEEFINIGEEYENKKSTSLERKLNEMQKTLDLVTEYNVKLLNKQQQERISFLNSSRNNAIQEGDINKFNEIDNQLVEAKKEVITFDNKKRDEGYAKDFASRNNEWFNDNTFDNKYLMDSAIAKESQLAKQYPDMPTDERLYKVEQYIKSSEYYNNRFSNKNRDRPTDINISSSSKENVKSKKALKTFNDLPIHAKKTVDELYRNYDMPISKEEYVKQLFEEGLV